MKTNHLIIICLVLELLYASSLELHVAKSLGSTTRLNDDVEMPLFGLGLYLSEPGTVTEDAVTFALEHGYRMFDTAQYYGNEADVGGAIRRAGLKREDVFIVSKVDDVSHGLEETIASVKASLEKMQTSYVDLFLIHSPYSHRNIETYKALHFLKSKGLIRSVGVSNFGVHHMEGLREAGLPPPSVNQIELHPFQRKEDIVKYCVDHEIAVMGYSPLTRAWKMDDQDVLNMAHRYNKTAAQVMIRWSVQNMFITIPKSTRPQRILENADVFDFVLDNEDMEILSSKPMFSCSWDPTVSPWQG